MKEGELPYNGIWCRVADAEVAGGHVDSFTTSVMLHLGLEAVRMDRIVNLESQEPDWDAPTWISAATRRRG